MPPSSMGLRPMLSEPAALEKSGTGILTIVSHQSDLPVYGRSITVAEILNDNRVLLGRSGDVPASFKQYVEEYYRSLTKKP